jgi:general secretion pathway protein I
MRRREAEAAGFTLVEVLVAFTIATLLLTVLVRGVGLGTASLRRTEAYANAMILAESVLDAMGEAVPLAEGAEADLRNGPFLAHATVHRYRAAAGGDENGYVVPYEVTATVLWQEGGRQRTASLRTVRLGPPR